MLPSKMMETFSIKMVRCLPILCFNFQMSVKEYSNIEKIKQALRNAMVDNGPSTSNGGSRQSAPVEDVNRQQRFIYICFQCDKPFNSTRNLSLHIRSDHKKVMYHCDACLIYFYNESNLNDHILVDHRGYPFFCEDCKRYFDTRESLIRHMNRCHSEIDKKCGICPQRYSKRNRLVRHMKKKHGILQTNCDVCQIILPHEKLFDHKLKIHNTILFDPKWSN